MVLEGHQAPSDGIIGYIIVGWLWIKQPTFFKIWNSQDFVNENGDKRDQGDA
jgi:hypothetical protein